MLLSVVVPEPIVIFVEVDDLQSEDFATLEVLRIILNDRVNVLKDAVWLLIVRHVSGVILKLAQNAATLALV